MVLPLPQVQIIRQRGTSYNVLMQSPTLFLVALRLSINVRRGLILLSSAPRHSPYYQRLPVPAISVTPEKLCVPSACGS